MTDYRANKLSPLNEYFDGKHGEHQIPFSIVSLGGLRRIRQGGGRTAGGSAMVCVYDGCAMCDVDGNPWKGSRVSLNIGISTDQD